MLHGDVTQYVCMNAVMSEWQSFIEILTALLEYIDLKYVALDDIKWYDSSVYYNNGVR